MYNFEFVKPSNVADALAALASEEAQALGGGQTLIPTMKQRLASPEKLVSLSGISEMQGVDVSGNIVTIGGATTHANVAAADAFSGLTGLASGIGDPAVRNRGTIGGSLANNDPAACYPSAVLALNAKITTNERSISASDYFTGMFETCLNSNEIITKVTFSIPDKSSYIKFPNPASRYAMVGVFMAKNGNDIRVAVTGAGENGVFRSTEIESVLNSNCTLEALENLEISHEGLLSDIHASDKYRANLIKEMAKKALEEIL